MSRYAALTAVLLARKEAKVILTFDELDAIVGILPNSAKIVDKVNEPSLFELFFSRINYTY